MSKFDFARAVKKTFWTKLADVDGVTFLTEKELNRAQKEKRTGGHNSGSAVSLLSRNY